MLEIGYGELCDTDPGSVPILKVKYQRSGIQPCEARSWREWCLGAPFLSVHEPRVKAASPPVTWEPFL